MINNVTGMLINKLYTFIIYLKSRDNVLLTRLNRIANKPGQTWLKQSDVWK